MKMQIVKCSCKYDLERNGAILKTNDENAVKDGKLIDEIARPNSFFFFLFISVVIHKYEPNFNR